MAKGPALPKVFDRGIDQDHLQLIRERFLRLNQVRLLRARSALKARQQVFFDLLPLLFHLNHPVLPGYVGKTAPCGLDNFTPSDEHITRARHHLAQSFEYRGVPKVPATTQLHSLFLMGSSGTVAHSPNSDLDIWLCHRARLDPEALTLLQRKAEAVTVWAKSLGLEIHIFLMESEQFRRGQRDQLSAESAGTSQHFLLLDEFYRSAILLAGRYPIWWLVPPEEEINYSEYAAILRSQGHVGPGESIDFGGVSEIPAGEFIGAGVWQLYKAISAPYKAILKLLLTEAYARESPRVDTLSLTFKRQLYLGEADPDELDPYVLVYQKLEKYLLQRGEPERLALVQRAFYFKTGQHLSRPALGHPEWQRQLLQKLIQRWEWLPEQLLNLDTQHRWKMRRVRNEHQLLVAELTDSYRFLQEFARKTQRPALINSQEMALLGRKLYAAYERKRNKVEWLNPGIGLDLSEEQLFFRTEGFADKRRWQVSNQVTTSTGQDDVLYSSDHLSEVLCWCHCNGLIGQNSRLRLEGHPDGIDQRQLEDISAHLHRYLPKTARAADPASHLAFSHPKTPETVLFYCNLGQDALSSLGRGGTPNDDNAFPVSRMEMVVINSWGEVMSMLFTGPDTMIKTFRSYQQLVLAALQRDRRVDMQIRCFNDPSDKLQRNLLQLARDADQWLYRTGLPGRFVLKLSDGFHIMQSRDNDLLALHAPDYGTLIQCLGRGQTHFSPIMLERHCVPNSALACITSIARSAHCHLFCYPRSDAVDIFVCDEKGSLSYLRVPGRDADTALCGLINFLQSCNEEQQFQYQQPRCFMLIKEHDHWRSSEIPGSTISAMPYSPSIEARACKDEQARLVFDLRCGDVAFPYQQYRDKQLDAVALWLLANDPHNAMTPPLIGRLQLGNPHQQSAVYLRYKLHLESLINSALERQKSPS